MEGNKIETLLKSQTDFCDRSVQLHWKPFGKSYLYVEE